MVRDMGWYDDVISERDDFQDSVAHGEMLIDEILYGSDSLEHSSGPWKKHKYVQKIGEGAKAKYKYAKDKAAEIASDPKSAIGISQRKKWKYNEDRADVHSKAAKEMSDEWDETVKEFGDKPGQDPDNWRYQVHPATIGYKDTTVNWKNYKNKKLETAMGYRKTADESKKQYDKTPLGKAEKTVSRAKEILDKKKKKYFSKKK